ncbi:MAG: hypothetical protein OHK006_06770 [Thermodesulfovibrionales bacterium]
MSALFRAIFIALLIAAVLLEGYYIMVLRQRVSSSSEELKNISVQLQNLKLEREKLYEDFSAARKSAGERQHELTTEGQH